MINCLLGVRLVHEYIEKSFIGCVRVASLGGLLLSVEEICFDCLKKRATANLGDDRHQVFSVASGALSGGQSQTVFYLRRGEQLNGQSVRHPLRCLNISFPRTHKRHVKNWGSGWVIFSLYVSSLCWYDGMASSVIPIEGSSHTVAKERSNFDFFFFFVFCFSLK